MTQPMQGVETVTRLPHPLAFSFSSSDDTDTTTTPTTTTDSEANTISFSQIMASSSSSSNSSTSSSGSSPRSNSPTNFVDREGGKERDKKKKEKKRSTKDYTNELRQSKNKDKKRTKKKKKQEGKDQKAFIRTMCSDLENEEKKSGSFIAPRISLAPLQNISLPLSDSPTSPFPSGAFSPLPKPPALSSDSDEELEDICKQCCIEIKAEASNEPLRCPAPTPLAMRSGEVQRTRGSILETHHEKSIRLMEQHMMTAVLSRSISMPTLIRKPIAVAALKASHKDPTGKVVPRLNLANVYLMESFASRLERLNVSSGPESERTRSAFQMTPRSAFTLTPRSSIPPQTAHI